MIHQLRFWFACFLVAAAILGNCDRLVSADFFMKSVDYSGGTGLFGLTTDIPAGTSASFTITFTLPSSSEPEETKKILQSLRTSLPATVSIAKATSAPNTTTTITVSIASATAQTATCSYSKSILPEMENRLSYDIRIAKFPEANAVVKGKLSGFARLADESNSNARWNNATLTLRQGNELLKFANLNMSSGQTIIQPIPEAQDCCVTLSRNPDIVDGENLRQSFTLKNNCNVTIYPGRLRIFATDALLLESVLTNKVPPNEDSKFIGDVVLNVTKQQASRWHEEVSFCHGRLTYRQWNGTLVTVTNTTKNDIQFKFKEQSETIHTLGPGAKISDFNAETRSTKDVTVDLLNVLPEVPNNLREIQIPKSEISSLTKIADQMEAVIKARNAEEALVASKTVAQSLLREAQASAATAEIQNELRIRIEQIDDLLLDVAKPATLREIEGLHSVVRAQTCKPQ